MAPSESQIAELRAFVLRADNSLGWKFTAMANEACATMYAPITEEFGWTLQLIPRGNPWHKDYTQWEALCNRDAEVKMTGSLDHCVAWLGRRLDELKIFQAAAEEARDYGQAEKGWQWVEKGMRGKPFSIRKFDFPEIGEQVALYLTPRRVPAVPLVAWAQLAFEEGPFESTSGDLGEVRPWLTAWQRLLEIPGRLRDCDSYEQAETILKPLSRRDLIQIGHALDLEGIGLGPDARSNVRTKLLQTFCPEAARTSD